MLNPIEEAILKEIETMISYGTQPAAQAYKDLMEGYRCRIDAEMMHFSFAQAQENLKRAEQVAQAVAGKTMGYSE